MREIIGDNLEIAIQELGIAAEKTYQSQADDDFAQVWEMSDEDHKKLCDIKEEDWKDNWGWWRSAEGSNIESDGVAEFVINGKPIKAYYNQDKLDEQIEWYLEDDYTEEFNSKEEAEEHLINEYFSDELQYSSFLDYCSEEYGCSVGRNVTAIAMAIAKLNNITIGELFNTYQK